jgi:hypothetical protein
VIWDTAHERAHAFGFAGFGSFREVLAGLPLIFFVSFQFSILVLCFSLSIFISV